MQAIIAISMNTFRKEKKSIVSEYLNIYITTENKEVFIPLGTFCRSTKIYEVMSANAPYEKIRELTIDKLNRLILEIKANLISVQKRKKNYKKALKLLGSKTVNMFPTYFEIISTMEYLDEEIEEYKFILNRFEIYNEILNDYNEVNTQIYYGIECYPPTVEDIID